MGFGIARGDSSVAVPDRFEPGQLGGGAQRGIRAGDRETERDLSTGLMPAPLPCGDLAAAVMAQPCPLLFLDTAAILDILRVPFRHELQVDIVDSAATIVDEALADPRRVWLVTSANVVQEFEGRRDYVMDELNARIRDLNLSIARISSVAKIAFPERRISWVDLPELKLPQRIQGIMD